MDYFVQHWWLLAIAIVVVIALAFLLARPRQKIRLSDDVPRRPHMIEPKEREGRGLASEAAAAASDVAGAIVDTPIRRTSGRPEERGDDLLLLKGVGPKLADTLHGLGFSRFAQIASLSANEVERLDGQLGAFRGRLARDRIVEQADYLARNDVDGFEQRFGKL